MSRIPRDQYEASTGPFVTVSAGKKETVEMHFPYCRDASFARSGAFGHTRAQTDFDFMNFNIHVLNPLTAANPATAQIQIWVGLKDASVMQGGLTDFTISPQGEEQTKQAGFIGKTMSSFAGLAQTTGSLASNAMDLLGLSKPETTAPATMVRNQFAYGVMNSVGVDNSQTMSLSSSANVISPPGVFPDGAEDPMLVHTHSSMPGLVWQGSYDTAKTIVTFPVGVGLHQDTGVGPSVKPRCAAVAGLFQFWRGDMHFHFELAKASGHSGMLEILVDYNGIRPVNSSARSASLHRVIWDITLKDKMTVVVPYIGKYSYTTFTHWVPGQGGIDIPTLTVRAVTNLVTTPNVATSVGINVYTSCPNLEVAFPSVNYSLDDPTASFTDQSKILHLRGYQTREEEKIRRKVEFVRKVKGGSIRPEGPYDRPEEHELEDVVVLCSDLPRSLPAEKLAAHTVIERVVSLAHLLKRGQVLKEFDTTLTGPQVIHDYSKAIPWPELQFMVSRLFVFGQGGFNLKVAEKDRIELCMEQMVAIGTSRFPKGIPVAFAVQPGRSLELHHPNIYPKSVYTLKQDSQGIYHTPPIKSVVYKPSGGMVTYFVIMSMDDSARFGGFDYLEPTFDLDTGLNAKIDSAPIQV